MASNLLVLHPAQCTMLRVQGESMDPTAPAESLILVDRSCLRRHDGQIFVVWAAEGLAVKRATKSDEGCQLASDHPPWESGAFPKDAVVLGRVVWTARALL